MKHDSPLSVSAPNMCEQREGKCGIATVMGKVAGDGEWRIHILMVMQKAKQRPSERLVSAIRSVSGSTAAQQDDGLDIDSARQRCWAGGPVSVTRYLPAPECLSSQIHCKDSRCTW